jgi:hypothetical protein
MSSCTSLRSESIVKGNSVIATYAEVRDANTRGDLQQVILDTNWKNGPLTAAEVDEVRVLLGRAYQELFAGYRFSRILTEMPGPTKGEEFRNFHGGNCVE